MNFDPLRDDVANGVECEVLRGTTHGIGSLLAPPVSEIDQHAARWLLSKFVTDSSAGSERRSRLCEGKKKKMEIPPEKKKLKVYKIRKKSFHFQAPSFYTDDVAPSFYLLPPYQYLWRCTSPSRPPHPYTSPLSKSHQILISNSNTLFIHCTNTRKHSQTNEQHATRTLNITPHVEGGILK